MNDSERIDRIERRLDTLEQMLTNLPPGKLDRPVSPQSVMADPDPVIQDTSPAPVRPAVTPPPIPSSPSVPSSLPPPLHSSKAPARSVPKSGSALNSPVSGGVALAWGGGIALILAAAYLVGIGITSGWLTPIRQVLMTALGGFVMIGTGVVLRGADRPFASLVGAAGLVILYVTVLGAYLVHSLVPPLVAVGLVGLIAIAALVLHLLYRSHVYAVFALLGSFSAPLLIDAETSTLADLGIYLLIWNLVYCVVALQLRARYLYVVALYGSLLVLDGLWRVQFPDSQWSMVAGFQFAIFAIFAVQLLLFSRRQPMTAAEAWGHLPALILFYGVQYGMFVTHYPGLTPWLAVTFAALVYGLYRLGKRLAKQDLEFGSVAHAFAALVLFHAVFLDLLDATTRPLAGWCYLVGGGVIVWRYGDRAKPLLAYVVGGFLAFVIGYMILIFKWNDRQTLLEIPLAVVYPVAVYVGYFVKPTAKRSPLLFIAHLMAMISTLLIVMATNNGAGDAFSFKLSIGWGLLALGLIVVARWRRDHLLARSCLGIFALLFVKVLLFDLQGSEPLTRVLCLVALGLSLYGGGWVYRRIFASTDA